MRTFVIGDVHGSFEQLERLLKKTKLNLKYDRLIMLGDYIDRGPDSYLTVKKLIQLQKTYGDEHLILLRGNHEQMAVDYFEQGCRSFLWNGGKDTLKDFQKHGDNLENYVSFFKKLPTYYEDNHFIYVHGGIRHGIKLLQQEENDLLWLREEFYLNPRAEEKTVIFGHTPTLNITGKCYPYISGNRIGIDTGCVYGGSLTALELHDGVLMCIHQVLQNSKKVAS